MVVTLAYPLDKQDKLEIAVMQEVQEVLEVRVRLAMHHLPFVKLFLAALAVMLETLERLAMEVVAVTVEVEELQFPQLEVLEQVAVMVVGVVRQENPGHRLLEADQIKA